MKIAFTGTQGVGKTTSVYAEAYQQKINNPNKNVNILLDVARDCMFPINRSTTKESQKWIFCHQLCRELEESKKCDILICDRTILDAVSYTIVAGFEDLANSLLPLAEEHLLTYDKIIFLSTKKNSYNKEDGIRDTDDVFRIIIEQRLIQLYRRLGQKIPNWEKKFIER